MGRPQERDGFRQPSVGPGFYPAQKHRAIGRGRTHAPTVVYREVPVIAAGHMGPALRNVY